MPAPAGVPVRVPNTPMMAEAQPAPRVDSAAEPWFHWTEPAGGPDRRPARSPGRNGPAGRSGRGRVTARRRRAEHFRRRRRDLLVDAGAALVLALILASLTAGLGILLLLVVPLAAGLIAERISRGRRARRAAGPARRSRGHRRRPARG